MKNNDQFASRPATQTRVARLVDIAREAEVSVSTASRVLRGSELPVARAVAERVREAARRLGYVPNILARSLRGAQARTIGLIVGDMLDPYYGTVAEAVTERAESEHGLLAVVCNIQRDPRLELKYCQRLWEHRVDGLILTGGGFDQQEHAAELADLTRSMQAAGVHVVTLGPRKIDAPMFCVDSVRAGRMAARELLEAGHSNVGIVTGNMRSETARQRMAGCRKELAKAGIEPAILETGYDLGELASGLGRMLRSTPAITALLATSDFTCKHVFDWLAANGIAVPQTVSLIGICAAKVETLSVRLTSIDAQIAACSRAALDFIAARLAGDEPPTQFFVPVLRSGDTVAVIQG